MQHVFTTPIPRALAHGGFRVRADQSPAELFGQLRDSIDAFKGDYSDRLTNMETALNAIGSGNSAIGAPPIGAAADPEYSRVFGSYFRKGDGDDFLRKANSTGDRAAVHAAMSVGTAADGGYLAPVEWDRSILEAQRATSPMRRLATVQPTSVGAFTKLWNNDQWGSGWVGETAARPQTTNASLAPINFAAGEIYANPAVTQRLLDDAALNVEDWLKNSVREEFNRQEGIAFIAGNGVNKPAGFLSFAEGGVNAAAHPGGAIDVTEATITVDNLVDFLYGLRHTRVLATTNGLSHPDIGIVRGSIGNMVWGQPPSGYIDRSIHTFPGRCADFFKEYWRSLTANVPPRLEA